VVRALQEEGIDIAGKKTQAVSDLIKSGAKFYYFVTVCSKEAQDKCPIFPGTHEKLLLPSPNPSGFTRTDKKIIAQVRALRDGIMEKVWHFMEAVLRFRIARSD
jgi:arsenate reductase